MHLNPTQTQKSLWQELKFMCKFFREYAQGVLHFRKLGPCVTVYGSARLKEDNPYYQQAMDIGEQLTLAGFSVMTGGGPGIMEAANRGAYKTKHRPSAGCSIFIPYEQAANPYTTISQNCYFFFARKLLLTKFSSAFVALPGGFGTLDELFEMITLIKTERMRDYPIVLVGKSFWQPLMDFIGDKMIGEGTVHRDELAMITVTDSIEEVIEVIRDHGKV